jgi:hypothetical protein
MELGIAGSGTAAGVTNVVASTKLLFPRAGRKVAGRAKIGGLKEIDGGR